ncbi:MAG: DUF3488 and transglutaminase-like domain-containing protein, partial [Gammaproteobacteria bacterium]
MTRAELSAREVGWVALALLAGLVPHMQRFPVLLTLAFVGAAMWRVLGAYGRLPLPDRTHPLLWALKQLVAIVAFAGIYIAYHGQLGREAGVELLAALLGLKLLEMRNARDYYVVSFLGYFLVVTNFFYSQTMGTAVYMLVLVVFITAVLVQFNTPPAWRRGGASVRLATLMTAQAMPLMMIAFLLFPRLPGPLWGLPQDAFDGVTGLSDELTLGEVARLGLSDAIAFRVEFDGPVPRVRDRYWRGPVLMHSDGRTWRAARVGTHAEHRVEALGPAYRYRVTLEPHQERWLLGLEMVTRAEPPAVRTADLRLLSPEPVRRRIRYELHSVVDYRLLGLAASERRAALTLPAGYHPRARQLAGRWASAGGGPIAIAERALAWYRDNDFVYSLTPPALPGDVIDEFLFETREGFCEHFAASFVTLMRAAGVPARIVTGYQGGEFNSLADYLVIREREAHAWAEIYDDEAGWVRVDPTATVAPERVSLGLEDALPADSQAIERDGDGVASALLVRLRDGFDAITYGWNQWVLGYTTQQQQRLLERFGFEDADTGGLVIALTLALAAATGVLGLLILADAGRRGDPAQQAWQVFCRRLARIGLARAPSEAPRAYAHRVARARADL